MHVGLDDVLLWSWDRYQVIIKSIARRNKQEEPQPKTSTGINKKKKVIPKQGEPIPFRIEGI